MQKEIIIITIKKHKKSLSDSEIKLTAHANPFEILGMEDEEDACDNNLNAEEMSVDDIKEETHQCDAARQTKDCKEWEEAHGDLLGECKGLEDCMVERDNEVDEFKHELYCNKIIHCIDVNEKRVQIKENDQFIDDHNKVIRNYNKAATNNNLEYKNTSRC